MSLVSDDTEELEKYLGENWGLLVGMARRLAGPAIDPDDLLAEALLSTFRRWRTDAGGIEHLNAYIVSAMRNRVKDELKSARSQVTHFDGTEELIADPHPALARIDLHAEIVLLREAMMLLPEDQRRVLRALYFEEEKVGQLTEAFQRSRPAVSQLVRRAKSNLKRTMLRILLERDAPTAACRRAAYRLPEQVDVDPPASGYAGRHVRRCARCRRTWAQFTMYSAFAFVGAFSVCAGVLGGGAEPAAAAVLAASADEAADTTVQRKPGHRWRRFSSVALVATGAGVSAYLIWAVPQQFAADTSHFDVAATPGPNRTVAYDVSFDSDARNWTIESLEIAARAPVESVDAPEGWECETVWGSVRCLTTRTEPVSARFRVAYSEATPPYELRLLARTPAGASIEGIASDEQFRGGGR